MTGFETIGRDWRFAVRTLVRNPGFTCAAVLTLAVGIGANPAMFSVVQGVTLAPVPFPDSERLVFLRQNRPGVPQLEVSVVAQDAPAPAPGEKKGTEVK